MVLKIINKSSNPLPRYESAQAAGMDIRCNISEPITLAPMERKLIPTGLFIELPAGYEAQTIEPGERICQMVIAKHETPEVVEVNELSDTERGTGGFGHSGRK